MNDIVNTIFDNLIQILSMVITSIIAFFGMKIKKLIENYMEDKIKKEIVEKTVMYVEQTGKDLSCNDKKKRAIQKSLEWLKEKKINVSDTELEILIESAVNCL